jgi:hypothetical protein
MKFILLPAGSGGFSWENTLARLFPPQLSALDQDGLLDSMAYNYRITRRGEHRNPEALAGVRIVKVTEGRGKYRPTIGTRGSRRVQRWDMCA